MARLSLSIEHIKSHYPVVVVGSGYGGGIAASRLSRAGQQVCVLERGKEFQAGDFPDTLLEGRSELQTDKPEGHKGSRTALYDLRINKDINILVGCGLGGIDRDVERSYGVWLECGVQPGWQSSGFGL